MLDDALAETGGSGDYQTLAIVSDGMTTSWGVDEQQTFNYEDKNGDKTNEPTDDFLRGHVQRILDLLSHCYIDTDGDGTKEKFDGGSTDEPGTYDPLQWMNDNATKIEQDIKDYANKTISTDEASNVTTSLEAGGYRAARLLRSLLTSDGTDGQRKYLVVFDQQAEAYSHEKEDILFGVRCGLMNCLVYGGGIDTAWISYVTPSEEERDLSISVDAVLTLATESGTQDGVVVDVIGKGPDDGHGNTYDFSFVSDPDTLSLTIGDTAYEVDSCTPGDKFLPMGGTLPSDVTVYTFGEDPTDARYSIAELYYCPNGLRMLSGTTLDGLYTPPIRRKHAG